MTRSVSRTLEYSYNDFVIASMGSGLGGHESDVQKYLDRSENWQNLYNDAQTSYLANGTNTGFKGFFQPKYLNQTWGVQDPLKCSNIDNNPNSVCSLQNSGAETFESSIWEYSLYVQSFIVFNLLPDLKHLETNLHPQFRTPRPSQSHHHLWRARGICKTSRLSP